MEHALEFRDDFEKVEAPPEVEKPPETADKASKVDDTMSSSVTPGVEPAQAAGVVAQLQPAEQEQAVRWLSQHMGAIYAAAVVEMLEGADGEGLAAQLDSLGASTAEAAAAAPSFSFGIQEQSAAEGAKDQKYAGKETLATYSDPIMGEFQVLFDVDKGVSSMLNEGVVTVFSTSGLTLRTPQGLPDVTIKLARMDLKTGEVEIISDPSIGPFEEKLIGQALRTSVLSGMENVDSQADLATSLGLEVNKDGMIPLYESFWADVYLDASASITTTLSDKSILLYFSEPIFCDIFGPVNLHIQAIEYNFRTASIDLIPSADGSMVGVALEEYASRLGEGFANDFIQGKMPAAMKKAGYSPKADPKLQENFQELLSNMGASGDNEVETKEESKGKGQESEAPAKEGDTTDKATQNENDPMAGLPEGNYLPLYKIETEAGVMALAIDRDDALQIEKNTTELEMSSTKGIYVVAPGAEWIQDLRIFDLRYNLIDGEITINASEEIGELVTDVLESMIRLRVLPNLPEELLTKLEVLKDEVPLELEEMGEMEVLYETEAEGLGQVQILADETDSINISRSATGIEIMADRGIRMRVLGSEWIPELVIGRLAYDQETGQIEIEPPIETDDDTLLLDLGPLTEQALAAVIRTQMLPKMPGHVVDGAGLEATKEGEALPEALDQTIASDTWGALGEVDISMMSGDSIAFGNGADEKTAKISQGLMVRLHGMGFAVRIYELGFDPKTGKVRVVSDPQLGSYEEALIGGALGEFVMPELESWMAEHDEDLTDTLNVLYRMDMGSFGMAKICVETGDSVQVQRDEKSLSVTSDKGIFWLSEGDAGKVLPDNRITKIKLDLETGEVIINARSGIGPFLERVATRVLQTMALPQIDAELREKIFGENDPLKEKEKIPKAHGNVLWSSELGDMGPIDVSIREGDKISVGHGPQGIKIDIGGGVLVRLPGLGLHAKISTLGFDPATGKLEIQSNPPMGPYERQMVAGALETYVMPSLQTFMAQQDDNQNDETRVLYKADLGEQGMVRVCVEESDTLQIDEDNESISVSASQGIFWLAEGDVAGMLPANRIRRISLSLKTGEVEIDADQDIGELGELVATRVLQSAVLPKLDASMRDKIFGGNDPLQAHTPDVPDAGDVLYEGEAAGMGFDVSIHGGKFSLTSTPGGQFSLGASSGGIMLRIPEMGLAVTLFGLTYNPANGTVTYMRTHPSVGAGEMALIERAISTFAGPTIADYTKGSKTDQANGLRTVASFEGMAVKVNAEDALRVTHHDKYTEIKADGGLLIESSLLSKAPPRIQAIRYEHGSGDITLDLVDEVDGSVYRDQTEVSGFTQEAIGGVVRRMLDPHLTPELRKLGLAGKEGQAFTNSGRPRKGETTWLDTQNEMVGRIKLFTQESDKVTATANDREFVLSSEQGIRLVLPELGVSQTFFSLRYDYQTDDVQLGGMGRLENSLLSNVARSVMGPALEGQGVDMSNAQGMVGQMREGHEHKKDGTEIIKTEDATLHIPPGCVVTAGLTGNGLRVTFRPKVWIDGPSVGNFYLDKIKYDFATAEAEVDIDGSNILSAIFEGIGEKKATAPLQKLMDDNLPVAMRQPGYNLFSDPNKQDNLAELFANFSREPEASGANK